LEVAGMAMHPPIKKPFLGRQRGKAKEGLQREYMLADSGEGNTAKGKDLEQH